MRIENYKDLNLVIRKHLKDYFIIILLFGSFYMVCHLLHYVYDYELMSQDEISFFFTKSTHPKLFNGERVYFLLSTN